MNPIPEDDPPGAPELTPDQAELVAEHAERINRTWAPRPLLAEPGLLVPSIDAVSAAIAARLATPKNTAAVEENRASLAAMTRRAVTSLAASRGLPPAEGLRSIATNPEPPSTPALEAVRAIATWRGRRRAGVVRVLAGPPGTGKSCAAAWACLWDRPGTPREVSALYVGAAEIRRTPRNAFSEHLAMWKRWTEMPLLVIDDLGLEGEAARDDIALLLLERYESARVTICTANLTDKLFGARYLTGETGPRLADRMVREQGHRGLPTGLPWYVAIDGESMRGAA